MNIEETKHLRGVELLRAVKQHILAEPKRLNMGLWQINKKEDWDANARDYPECGTIACIAGWACLLGGVTQEERKQLSVGTADAARQLLGIDEAFSDRLFHITGWPGDYCMDYCRAFDEKNKIEQARIAGEVIDWFITTYLMSKTTEGQANPA